MSLLGVGGQPSIQEKSGGAGGLQASDDDEANIDGAPMSGGELEDLDGIPLDGAALLKGALRNMPGTGVPSRVIPDEDLDGVPS